MRQWTTADDVWPKAVQQPRPWIIVGGRAKPRTVRAAIRFADEYNTAFASVDEARERRAIVDDAAREAGREPLVFSLMTGCVVGRDEADVNERLAGLAGPSPGARRRRRSSERSSRSSPRCATTRRPASSG